MKFSQANIQNEIQSGDFLNWNSVRQFYKTEIQSRDFLNWNSVRQFSNWNSVHKLL